MFEAFGLLPEDEHDQELAENVHPVNWINPSPMSAITSSSWRGTAGLITAIVSEASAPKWRWSKSI
jgi:hypothetical protein